MRADSAKVRLDLTFPCDYSWTMKNTAGCHLLLVGMCVVVLQNAVAQGLPSMTGNAPGVTGTYYHPWSPLGPTDKGFIFAMGLNFSGSDRSGPIVVWIPKSGSRTPTEVRSLSGMNMIARELTAGQSADVVVSMTIQVVCRTISDTAVNKSVAGFALDPNGLEKPNRVLDRLIEAGLDRGDVDLLRGLLQQAGLIIGETEWQRIWFEVDAAGSIEKITAGGPVESVSLRFVTREIIYGAGRIDGETLKKERRLQREQLIR